MKKNLFLLLVSIIVSSCGGESETLTPENRAPSKPSLIAPTNNLLCIDNEVQFDWNAATDPDGNTISYQIQIAKDNQFSQIVYDLKTASTTTSQSLDKGVDYYWRIKAIDSENASSDYSSTYQFYTEGEGETNHLPFTTLLIKPEMNAVVQTITVALEWNANDIDIADNLTFDIYFGTSNPPTVKVSENQSSKSFEVDLSSSNNYYWKVDVKDNNGGITKGQVWTFKTD